MTPVRKQFFATLVLAGITALLVAQSPPPPPTPSPTANENQQASPYETQQSKPSDQPTLRPTPNRKDKPTETDQATKKPPRDWIPLLTFFIFLATAVQAWTAWLGAGYMKRGLSLTKQSADAAEKAAIAAKDSARAATLALKDSKDALQLTERAMIRMVSVTVNTLQKDSRQDDPRPFIREVTSVTFALKNFGKTEARAVKITWKLCLGEKSDTLADPKEVIIPPQGPHFSFSGSLIRWLDDAEITAITEKKATLRYEIQATYKDVFDVGYSYTATGVWNQGSRSFYIRGNNETVI
jgi:hypothetical protein